MRSMDLICGDPVADPTGTNTIAEVRAYLENSTASFFPAVQLIALAVCDEVARLEALVAELRPWAEAAALLQHEGELGISPASTLSIVRWHLRNTDVGDAYRLLERIEAGEFGEEQ